MEYHDPDSWDFTLKGDVVLSQEALREKYAPLAAKVAALQQQRKAGPVLPSQHEQAHTPEAGEE
jgi:hypothetical protein